MGDLTGHLSSLGHLSGHLSGQFLRSRTVWDVGPPQRLFLSLFITFVLVLVNCYKFMSKINTMSIDIIKRIADPKTRLLDNNQTKN